MRSRKIRVIRSAWRCISATGARQVSGIVAVLVQRVEIPADDRERRAQLVRSVRHEVAARALDVLLVRDVANDRESLILAVRDDLHVQPARFVGAATRTVMPSPVGAVR